MNKNHKGITLIALVVTIVVLLILAGIVISMITGKDGVIEQAEKARELYERKQVLEAAQSAYILSKISNQDEEESIIVKEAIKDLKQDGYKIYTQIVDGAKIKSIKYMLNNGKIEEATIKKGTELEVELSTEFDNLDDEIYYIQINNKYYLLTMYSDQVTIGEMEVDIESIQGSVEEGITEIITNDPTIITVDLNETKTGITIKGKTTGETVILARTNLGTTAILKVVVTNNATGITISSTAGSSIKVGDSTTLTATLSPIDASDSSITWSVGDTSIAQLSSTNTTVTNGKSSVKVTGKKAGNTTITARSSSGMTKTYNLTVIQLAKSIVLNYTEKEIIKGSTLKLVATILPSDTSDKTVKWSSSDTTIATVDENGLVSASSDKTGSAIILAETSNGLKATATINVVEVELVSNKVTVGSIINYKTLSKTYTATKTVTGISESQTFKTTSAKIPFVVMRMDEGIEIVPLNSIGELALFGVIGYENGIDVLNNIANLYANTTFSSKVESLGNDGKDSVHAKAMKSLYYTYGCTNTYGEHKLYVTSTKTDYKSISDLYTSNDTSTSGELVWLASETVGSPHGLYYSKSTYSSKSSYYYLFDWSHLPEYYYAHRMGVVPVVTLRDDLNVVGGAGTVDSPFEIERVNN